VVLATTTHVEDDRLMAAAALYGVPAFRGPSEDVLQRFALVARAEGARYIVRATADNPAVDIDAPRRLLAILRATGADYVAEDGMPYGAAVEAFTVASLLRADSEAVDAYDREHVTPFLRRGGAGCRTVTVPAPDKLRGPTCG